MKLFGFDIKRSAPETRSTLENPNVPLTDANISALLYGDAPGVAITPQSAMKISAVYACVRVLAESFAMLPVNIYERSGSNRNVISMPLADVLGLQANSYQGSFQYRELAQACLGLWGNHYAEIQRNTRTGEVIGLYPLPPGAVSVSLKDGKKWFDCNGVKLSQDEIFHVPGLGYNGITGLSPIQLQQRSLSVAVNSDAFGDSFFRNGTKLSGVLQHPGKLSKDAADRLRAKWQETYAGSSNGFKVAVVEEGMQFKEISLPPADAQFIETRKYSVSDIARIFRVPPHMVGDLERATFSNIEQQSIEFVQFTMLPWVTRFEQEINRQLFSLTQMGNYFVKFNLAALLRGDIKSRYEAYSIGRNGGWLSVNDIRALEDMNPIDNGNTYLEPLNMVEAGTQGQQT